MRPDPALKDRLECPGFQWLQERHFKRCPRKSVTLDIHRDTGTNVPECKLIVTHLASSPCDEHFRPVAIGKVFVSLRKKRAHDQEARLARQRCRNTTWRFSGSVIMKLLPELFGYRRRPQNGPRDKRKCVRHGKFVSPMLQQSVSPPLAEPE